MSTVNLTKHLTIGFTLTHSVFLAASVVILCLRPDPDQEHLKGADDITTVSGFYGPGTYLSWLLTVVSAVATSIKTKKYDTVDVELFTAIAYPFLSSIDAILRALEGQSGASFTAASLASRSACGFCIAGFIVESIQGNKLRRGMWMITFAPVMLASHVRRPNSWTIWAWFSISLLPICEIAPLKRLRRFGILGAVIGGPVLLASCFISWANGFLPISSAKLSDLDQAAGLVSVVLALTNHWVQRVWAVREPRDWHWQHTLEAWAQVWALCLLSYGLCITFMHYSSILIPRSIKDSDDLTTVSGFYGPGTYLSWLVTVTSATLAPHLGPSWENPIDIDLILAITYPLIAAADVNTRAGTGLRGASLEAATHVTGTAFKIFIVVSIYELCLEMRARPSFWAAAAVAMMSLDGFWPIAIASVPFGAIAIPNWLEAMRHPRPAWWFVVCIIWAINGVRFFPSTSTKLSDLDQAAGLGCVVLALAIHWRIDQAKDKLFWA